MAINLVEQQADRFHTSDELREIARIIDVLADLSSACITLSSSSVSDVDGDVLGTIDFKDGSYVYTAN